MSQKTQSMALKSHTLNNKLNRGINDNKKKYTTCRLKTNQITSDWQASLHLMLEEKTYTLMYENNCPSNKCVYNPWQKEPSIDDVVDSLNSIKK